MTFLCLLTTFGSNQKIITVSMRFEYNKMSELKLEHRSIRNSFIKEENGPKNIHERVIDVYGEDAPSYFIAKF